VARWFVAIGVVSTVIFVMGATLIMMLVADVRAQGPRRDIAAQLDRLNVALIVLLAVVAAVGIGLVFIVRFAVLKPIAQLTDQVRKVAAGDFDHQLSVERPAELAELSSHVDSMRRRVVTAWRRAEEQADELRRSNGAGPRPSGHTT
jgi:nitrogen fixation/metabolism regulation signal transduction histidine kinase